MKPYLAGHLKDMNRLTVYNLLAEVGEISKAEISRRTGISGPTIIKIASFFIENGFVTEAGEGDSPLGRKPQILKFNPEAAYAVGVNFEGDFLKIGIVDLLGKIIICKHVRVPRDFNEIITVHLPVGIDSIIREAKVPKSKVLGIGLGIPGVISIDDFIIDFAPLVGIHERTDYREIIRDFTAKLGLPVFLENDVNASAIGEFVTRKLGNDKDLIYISIGTGLGAGIILDGKLRRGTRNAAGEIGYTVMDKKFKTQKSDAGWMESRITIAQTADDISSDLALCIANIAVSLDFDLAVIGGVKAEIFGDSLINSVNNDLERLSLNSIKCEMPICEEPGVVGAASIVVRNKLEELLS